MYIEPSHKDDVTVRDSIMTFRKLTKEQVEDEVAVTFSKDGTKAVVNTPVDSYEVSLNQRDDEANEQGLVFG